MIRPWMFPAAQIAFYVLAASLAPHAPITSFALLLVAARAQSLALHIYVHESVHHPVRTSGLRELHETALTILTGLPFEGYRWHHLDHHRHENSLQDISSTWARNGRGRPVPRSLWGYSLSWPMQTVRVSRAMRAAALEDATARSSYRRLRLQQLVILFFMALLGAAGGAVWVIDYVLLTYLGWVATSLHNYGQHPPIRGRTDWITSQQDPLYNGLMCNNGLHFEHHRRPAIPWHKLRADRRAPAIDASHLLMAWRTGERPQEHHPFDATDEGRRIAC